MHRNAELSRSLILLIGLLLLSRSATAQHASFDDLEYRSEQAVSIERLSGPIQLDGRVDEEAWEAITPIPWHVYGPTTRSTASDSGA